MITTFERDVAIKFKAVRAVKHVSVFGVNIPLSTLKKKITKISNKRPNQVREGELSYKTKVTIQKKRACGVNQRTLFLAVWLLDHIV